jgi:hypothetical protein
MRRRRAPANAAVRRHVAASASLAAAASVCVGEAIGQSNVLPVKR